MRIEYLHLKYQIDEILILNLPSRSDRKLAVQGAFDATGAMPDRMNFWQAMPASDFESIEDLVDAAVDDGFDFFRDAHSEGKLNEKPMAIPAQLWSYCQMLRYISEMEQYKGFLIIYDDRYIIDYCQFAQLWHFLRNSDSSGYAPFMMLQFDYYLMQDFNITMPKVTHPNMPYILEGPLGGSENAMGYTPEGARFFLDRLQNHICGNVETTLGRLSHLPRNERQGIWTVDFKVNMSFNDKSLWRSDIWK